MGAAERGGRPLPSIALVLGGGNALGAYHAGLYEALQEAEIEPDWIVGTSIGAINGALIVGNPRERRIEQLRKLWRPAEGNGSSWPMPWDFVPEDWRRTGSVVNTLLGGRPGMFGPIGSPSVGRMFDPLEASKALFDTSMLQDTLLALIDFDRLNTAGPRFTAVAVDIETGEEVIFDTSRMRLDAEHIRASAALLTAFPAVEVDGRLLGDGGLSMNLPIDPVLDDAPDVPLVCVAVDLLPLRAGRPKTLGEVIARTQDLTFAAQSRRTVERWRAVYAAEGGVRPPVSLVTLAYTAQEEEVAGKAMDFSPASIRHRWQAGYQDARRLVERLIAGDIAPPARGLAVIDG